MESANPSNQQPPAKAKKPKAEKQPYGVFLEGLKALIGSAEKDFQKSPAKIHAHLKHGFLGSPEKPQVEEVANLLFAVPFFPSVAIRAILDPNSGKGGHLLCALNGALRSELKRRIGFPPEIPELLGHEDQLVNQKISTWMDAQFETGKLNWPWAQACFGVLIGERLPFGNFRHFLRLLAYQAALRAGGKVGTKAKSVFREPDHKPLLRKVVNVLGTPAPNLKTLSFALGLVEAFANQNEELTGKADQLNALVHSLREEVRRLEGESERAKAALADAQAQAKRLEAEVASRDQDIQGWQKRYDELEKFWKGESQRLLASQAHKFKSAFSHEIQEAVLALDSNNPDTQMAISRLKNMQETLSRISNQEEKK